MNEQGAAQPDYPVLVCSIERTSAFKMDGEGSGSLLLTFDETQVETVTHLMKHYRMKALHVSFIKLPS